MTREEFNQFGFMAGQKAVYQGNEYPIRMIELTEGLLGIEMFGSDEDENWIRCESVEMIID